MVRKVLMVWVTSIVLCSSASAETIEPGQAYAASTCDQQVHTRDVLVLDLEPLRREPEMAQAFAEKRAGEFDLLSTTPEVIITRTRPSKNPDDLIRRARKAGAKEGCDLVLVLKTGPYFGRQRGKNPRVRDQGYAFVVMGHRTN